MAKNNSDIKLRFGIHKGKMLKNVPKDYLRWCVNKDVLRGRAMAYAKKRLNYPKDRYRVVVEDAVVGDGTYFVSAYTRCDVISTVRKENHIQITQSFCGTSFSATKV